MPQRKRSSDIPMNYNYCIYMDNLQSIHQQLESRYTYKRASPLEEGNNYWVYAGVQKQLNIQVTIKVIHSYAPELPKYLRKLKDCKVENVIKVIEIFEGTNALFLTTEAVTYSTLKKAISKYKKLDDLEAIFISKVILSIHVDMLRAGLNWFGTENDIQFTDNGLKLSWNNSIPYEDQNPFPLILSKLAGRIEIPQQKMLPFPKSKILDDLINISSLNASQISLNNNMKKKQKQLKRKGKGWLALKQLKNDLEYYEQEVFFAVHKEIGFARIKVYKSGQLDEQVLNLNKTKNTFTKVIQNYNEGGKTYLISEYSNDGSLYNYVNRLRANSINLKQQQIQFFFFSLFQPLKFIQQSTIKSLCMLHIKNIYIQNGIPKIGEPVPMNGDLTYQLKQKADVPDFYHSDFKRNPSIKGNTFDTYSLGVLMYKLMFTEYPIFPQKKVHIPTSPSYSTRLKTTLQLFLNEGGLLKDLEKKIQVSEQVTKQVKLNKNKLKLQKQNSKKGQVFVQNYDDQLIEKQQQKKPDQQTQVNQEEDEQDNDDCCKLCCAQLEDPVKHRSVMLDSLQQSPYSCYRLTIKIIVMLLILTFLYYFFFLQSANIILSNYNNLQRMNVTISTLNYEITVSDSNTFYKAFNVTDRTLSSLVNLGCFINNHDGNIDYSSIALSSNYRMYAAFSVITMIVIYILKIIQMAKFDIIKTLYNMSNLRANFNMTNYILQNLFLASLINSHFIFYHQIFKTTLPTCFGVDINSHYGSDEIFYSNSSNFSLVFITVHIGIFAAVILHLFMIVRTQTIRYTRLFNPILLLVPFLVAYIIAARLGAIQAYFYPSLLKNIHIYGNYFTSFNIVSLLGTAPQIFILLQLLVEWIVDWIFWFTFDKRRSMIIHDISTGNIVMEE